MSDIVVSSRVRLARNYEDLPFRHKITAAQCEACVSRTLDALRPLPEPYTYLPIEGMEENEKRVLVESHLISPDLLKEETGAAVLVRGDEKIAVMMNEEDHLRIQAFAPGENLPLAAQNREVSGRVLDTGGQPLIGAAVLLSGTTSGDVTDLDGSFRLRVPDGPATLEISCLGYVGKTVTVPVSQSQITVSRPASGSKRRGANSRSHSFVSPCRPRRHRVAWAVSRARPSGET